MAPEIASQVCWLPAGLHADLGRLKEALEQTMDGGEPVMCIYGSACHPDMGSWSRPNGGTVCQSRTA